MYQEVCYFLFGGGGDGDIYVIQQEVVYYM